MACAVDVDEVRPKPSCDQRTRAVPNAVRVRLRTACMATCGSSAQAWTHRSPSLRAGSSWSPGKCGSSDERRGQPARPGRIGRRRRRVGSDEQRPAEPDRDGEAGRRQVERLAGVVGRRVAGAAGRPERSGRQPGREPRRHRRPPAQQVDQLGARRRRQVERREVHAVLRGRHDAGLVRAGERVRPAAGGAAPAAAEARRRSAATSTAPTAASPPSPIAAAPPPPRRGTPGARRRRPGLGWASECPAGGRSSGPRSQPLSRHP